MRSQTFGEKLKELRTNLKYSLKFVGEKIGYSPKLLGQIERNQKKAPERIIKDLAKIYAVPYKQLMVKYLSESIYYQIRQSEYAEEVLDMVKRRVKKDGKGTREIKSKGEIIKAIKKYFENKPVEKAYIFGSFARNTPMSKDSDIDILVVFKKNHKITLFDLIQMKEELSDKVGREIDLLEEGQEMKSFKSSIQKEKVLVYAR